AAGLAEIRDRTPVAGLDRPLVERGMRLVEEEIAEAVDRMKTSAGDIPVVVVGGGSILLGKSLRGASEVVKPEHFAVANAIGAAIAQIGGEVDRVFSLEQVPREEALQRARD